jgi:zinc protease
MNHQITRIRLSNGLLVLLKEIHTAPLISNWMWYRVGSRDEIAGITGISHWVEHMQFKGTPRFPSKVLDRLISREGGYWNAFTFLDWTTYFETMPADKIELALRLEADRMLNSTFDPKEVESERTVIISERQGNENEPMFLLKEQVQAASFRVHPYHHEIIGDMSDLQTISRDELFNHYRKYYVPANAVLAIAGDFETQVLLDLIQELFEPIPSGDSCVRSIRDEPPARGEHRLTVEGPGETVFIQIAFHSPAATHPDFFPYLVMDSLLTGPGNLNLFGGGISNKTSRLYRALVEKELAVSVGGGVIATIDPYLHSIVITVHPQRTPEQVIAVLDEEILRIQRESPQPEELERAVKQARALFAYGSESITNQAYWMGYTEMFDSYDWFKNFLDRLSNVSPADVQRIAQTYLNQRNRVIGVYLPEKQRESLQSLGNKGG